MLRKIWGVARVEYMGFLTSKRVLFMLFSLIFFGESVVGKMGKLAAEKGFVLGRLEPFILLFSYKLHVMIVPIVFIVMMSNFPSNEKSGYFIMSRISRTSWLFGEVLYAGMTALTYILFLFLGSALWVWKSSSFFTTWSPYMSQLYMDYPEVYALNNQLFIKTETLAQGTPMKVMFHSVSLMLLYLVCVALLLMMFKLLGLKKLGIFVTISFAIIGVSLGDNDFIKWFFPIMQSIYETHFNSFYSKVKEPLSYSYIYFGILIVGLFVINQRLVKHHMIAEEGTE